MLFGIIIIVVAVVVAYLLNKSKITKVTGKVEEIATPTVEKVKEVVKEAQKGVSKNEAIKKTAKTTIKKEK